MIVTLDLLKFKKACEKQVKLFQATFGEQAEVTLENCQRAAKAGLDINWAARNLLPNTLWDAYKAQRQPLWDAFNAQHQSLWDAYDSQCWAVFGQIIIDSDLNQA